MLSIWVFGVWGPKGNVSWVGLHGEGIEAAVDNGYGAGDEY